MTEIALLIDNEIEWLKVIDILASNHFPYRNTRATDSAFPVINEDQFEIIIPQNAHVWFIELVGKEYPFREISMDMESNSKISGLQIGLILYALLMTFLFLKYYHLDQRNSYDKNFTYQWTYDNKALILIHKNTGEQFSKFHDRNLDFNYEKVEHFYKGTIMSELWDDNEDGIVDREKFYTVDGQFGGFQTDTNGDGLMDKAMTILESGDTLRFVDNNRNGFYELE